MAAEPWQQVIAIVLAHSGYDTIDPVYQPMPEGCKIKTILPAEIGMKCFARYSTVIKAVDEMIEEGYFHMPIRYIIDGMNASLKPFDPDPIFRIEDRADYLTFLGCQGESCTNEDEYYNKLWEFNPFDPQRPEDLGCILVLTIVGDKVHKTSLIEDKIRAGGIISKKTLIDLLCIKHKNILLIDLSCNQTSGTPETIAAFKKRGAYGGKRKSKRKSRRSKKR